MYSAFAARESCDASDPRDTSPTSPKSPNQEVFPRIENPPIDLSK